MTNRAQQPAVGFWTVVPAAGGSTRFGSPKALMKVRGQSALSTIVQSSDVGGTAGVVVVVAVGCEGDLRRALDGTARGPLVVAVNDDPGRGMISSIRVGMAEIPDGHDALVWPVDHPFVSASTVRLLAGKLDDQIVVPTYRGESGHPSLFPAGMLGQVMALDDSGGLNRLLAQHPDRVRRIAVDDVGVTLDIDRPEDLQAGLALTAV